MVRLTPHGTREILIGSILLLLLGFGLYLIWWPLVFALIPIWIWLLAFFRDPERIIPNEQHVVVSPADGKVSDVGEVHSELLGGPALRVGIFLSVFNVHVNRAPCDGRISGVHYKKGKFINAMSHSTASEQNESNTVVISDAATGKPIAVVKQIVGLIARRIICTVSSGDLIQRGQRIGMIKFGSRTELYLPMSLDPDVKVSVGQTVRGGLDIIAYLRRPVAAVETAPAPAQAEPAESAVTAPELTSRPAGA